LLENQNKTVLIYQTTRCHIPQDLIPTSHM